MKKDLLRTMILPVVIAIFLGCSNSMKKDARHLADVQKQKSEMVRNMLSCRDSALKMKLLDQINRLETRYVHESKKYRKKYCDSADQVAFEGYYKEFLRSKLN